MQYLEAQPVSAGTCPVTARTMQSKHQPGRSEAPGTTSAPASGLTRVLSMFSPCLDGRTVLMEQQRSSSSGLGLTSFALHQTFGHNKVSLKFKWRLNNFPPHATVIYKTIPTASERPRCRRRAGGAGSGEAASAPLPCSGAGPSPNNTGKTVNKTPDEWLVWISALLISVTIALWKTALGIWGPGCLCLSKHRAALYDAVQIGVSRFTDLMCTAL